MDYSLEAKSRSVTQVIPPLILNQNFHYRVHKVSPLVPFLGKINLLDNLQFCFLKTKFTHVLVFKSVSSEWPSQGVFPIKFLLMFLIFNVHSFIWS
jgi:hypothetical protein